jgi:hypothetical protein
VTSIERTETPTDSSEVKNSAPVLVTKISSKTQYLTQ